MTRDHLAMSVRSRSLGPPCSNLVTFQVAALPGTSFCAYAVPDGPIIMQQALKLSAYSQFATVLVIQPHDQPHSPVNDDRFERLAWGGGPHSLLAAATRHQICIFSLAPHFSDPSLHNPAMPGTPSSTATAATLAASQHAGQQSPQQPSQPPATAGVTPPSVAMPSTATYTLAAVYRTSKPIVSMDFTQQADGLLCTDAGGNVMMLGLLARQPLQQERSRRPTIPPSRDAGGSRYVRSGIQGDERRWWRDGAGMGRGADPRPDDPQDDGRGGDVGNRDQPAQGPGVSIAVAELWAAKTESIHGHAAAGLNCSCPAATSAQDKQQRVLVWRSHVHHHNHQEPSSPPSPRVSPPAGEAAAGEAPPATGAESGPVGSEVIRHPVKVMSMQWSPALHGRGGASPTSAPAPSSSSSAATASAGPARARHGPAAMGGAQGSGAAPSTPVPSAATGAVDDATEGGSALLTVGSDWVIRIWVEVFMRDLVRSESAPVLSGSPPPASVGTSSTFCLTLVIDPPMPGLLVGALPGLRACWARPLLPPASSTCSIPPSPGASASPAGKTVLVSGHSSTMYGNPTTARLLWIVATAGVQPSSTTAPYGGGVGSGGGSGSTRQAGTEDEAAEVVCVWAVDGLSSIVLSALPKAAVRTNKSAAPRAVLWGRDARSVGWLQPHNALPGRAEDYSLTGYVSYPGYVPVIHGSDVCVSRSGCYAEARAFRVATVTQDAGASASPHTGILVTDTIQGSMSGSPQSLTHLALHPHVAVAASLDSSASLKFWWVSPMGELTAAVSASASDTTPELLNPDTRVAAGRQQQAALDGCDGGVRGYLAAVFGGALHVYDVSLPRRVPTATSTHDSSGSEEARSGGSTGGSGGGSGGSSAASSWGVTILDEVLCRALPGCVADVTHLNVAAGTMGAVGDGAVTCTLVALATTSGGAGTSSTSVGDGGGRPSPTPARTAGSAAQTWVVWKLDALSCSGGGSPGLRVDSVRVVPLTETSRGSQGPCLSTGDPQAGTSGASGASFPASVASLQSHHSFTQDRASPSQPAPPSLLHLAPPSLVISGQQGTQQAAPAPPAKGDHSLSCLHMPAQQLADPGSSGSAMMTGSKQGQVAIWDLTGSGAPCVQQHCLWRELVSVPAAAAQDAQRVPEPQRQPRSSTTDGTNVASHAVSEQRHSPRGGAAAVAAVALFPLAGYAAAVVSCATGGESQDQLFIWQRSDSHPPPHPGHHTQPHTAVNHSTHHTPTALVTESPAGCVAGLSTAYTSHSMKGPDPGSPESCLVIGAGAEHAGPYKAARFTSAAGLSSGAGYELVASMPLGDTATSLAWVVAAGPLYPVLAVGHASGVVTSYCRGRDGGWEVIAQYGGSTTAVAELVTSPCTGGALVLTGSQVLELSSTLLGTGLSSPTHASHSHQHHDDSVVSISHSPDPSSACPATLASAAAASGGALPPYHPSSLTALISRGRLHTACRILTSVLDWAQRYSRLHPDAAQPSSTHQDNYMEDDGRTVASASSFLLARAPTPPVVGSGSSMTRAQVATATAVAAGDGDTDALSDPVPEDALPGVPLLQLLRDGPLYGAGLRALRSMQAGGQEVEARNVMKPSASASTVSSSSLSCSTGVVAGMPSTSQQQRQQLQQPISADPLPRPSERSMVSPTIPPRSLFTKPAAKPAPSSAMDSGMLDMSAFGMMGGHDDHGDHGDGDAEALQKEPVSSIPTSDAAPLRPLFAKPTVKPASSAAMDSGMLDMSAFGMMGGGDYGDHGSDDEDSVRQPVISIPTPATAPRPLFAKPTAAPPCSAAMDSGMLDMSAFGMMGGGDSYGDHGIDGGPGAAAGTPKAEDRRAGRPAASTTPPATAVALPRPLFAKPTPTPPPSSAMDSGMLDMAAFGMVADYGSHADEDAAVEAAFVKVLNPAAAETAAAGAAAEAAATTAAAATPSRPLSSKPSAMQATSAAATSSGVLDLSAFGMGGPSDGAAPSGTDLHSARATGGGAAQQPVANVSNGAPGASGVLAPQPPQLIHSMVLFPALETASVGASAGSCMGVSGRKVGVAGCGTVKLQQLLLPARDAARLCELLLGTSRPATDAEEDARRGSSLGDDEGRRGGGSDTISPPPRPLIVSPPARAPPLFEQVASEPRFHPPHLDPSLTRCLTHRPPVLFPVVSSRAAPPADRSSSPLLHALHLSRKEARLLCTLATALSACPPPSSPPAAAPGLPPPPSSAHPASSSATPTRGSDDVMAGLDHAGQLFLVGARIAAGLEAMGGGAGGGTTDGGGVSGGGGGQEEGGAGGVGVKAASDAVMARAIRDSFRRQRSQLGVRACLQEQWCLPVSHQQVARVYGTLATRVSRVVPGALSVHTAADVRGSTPDVHGNTPAGRALARVRRMPTVPAMWPCGDGASVRGCCGADSHIPRVACVPRGSMTVSRSDGPRPASTRQSLQASDLSPTASDSSRTALTAVNTSSPSGAAVPHSPPALAAAPARMQSLLSLTSPALPATRTCTAPPTPATPPPHTAPPAGGDARGGAGGTGGPGWWGPVGVATGVHPRLVFAALGGCGCQGALLEAALPHAHWSAEDDVRASPAAAARAAFGANTGASQRPPTSWPQLRSLGAGLWLTDPTACRAAAEELAKRQFSRHRDPHDAMLMYVALGKKGVLMTLFRQTSNVKIAEFLAKNFDTSADARASAAKNAFALIGQHRYELAASFFILSGSIKDAVGVLAHELGDPQLALWVARLLEGPGGPVASDLISQVREAGWCNSWADAPLLNPFPLSNLTDPDLAAATYEGMRRARHAGALVSFDLNLRPALWPKDADPRLQLWPALLLADVVKLSAEEFTFLAVDGEEAVLEALWQGEASLLVVTDGDKTMRWFHPDMDGQLPCYSVPMVDATAAGDAFVGGLLYQLAALDGRGRERLRPLLESLPRLHAVLRYAAACGAIWILPVSTPTPA
ncbi:MAG: hypothetical protein WDW38_004781 [Sanguina aurantia]